MPVNQVGVYLMIYFTHGRVGGLWKLMLLRHQKLIKCKAKIGQDGPKVIVVAVGT